MTLADTIIVGLAAALLVLYGVRAEKRAAADRTAARELALELTIERTAHRRTIEQLREEGTKCERLEDRNPTR